MNVIALIFAFLSLLMCVLLFLRIPAPLGFTTLFPKLAAGALSLVWGLSGVLAVMLGWLNAAPLAVVVGGIGTVCMAWYTWRVTRAHPGFEQAFGANWRQNNAVQNSRRLLMSRTLAYLAEAKLPAVRWERDIAFCKIPGCQRELLCDVWQPPAGTPPSGLALLFFHGSAWFLFDKDLGTRSFFGHLASQGHVVMDVAYRLCPEVDVFDMVGDVKRAVAWMKANASRFGVDPQRIVLGGGSAGGHLSMLAAYAPYHPRMTPNEIKDCDLTVRGVVSLYGPCDLRACYDHTHQERLVGLPKVTIGQAGYKKTMRDAGRLDILLGGHPAETPEAYQLASPLNHVHSTCPPTLLIQGVDDLITPVSATREIYARLRAAGVPAINVVYPCTTHAFDLILPQLSPSAQSASRTVDRFLALLT